MKALATFTLATAVALATATASAGRVGIVSENDLAKTWTLTPESARFVAGYPAAAGDKGGDVCVNLGFMIQADGSTSDYTLMKAWSSTTSDKAELDRLSAPFVQNAAAVVSRWKFVPTGKPRQLYTSATMAFRPGQVNPVELREHCRIDDLEQFVANAAGRKGSRQADEMRTRELMRSSSSGY
jgi:hypothetical protein